MDKNIKLLVPCLPKCEQLIPWLQSIDESNWYSNFGPLNQQLEKQLANLLKIESVVSCNNGTQAIELALKALGLKKNARILVPGFTFPATILAVFNAGYIPLLADIDPESWQLTPEYASQHYSNFKFDAVLPVATYGVPVDTEKWLGFSQSFRIPVVVDAAGAFGNQDIGQGLIIAFSMHATKSYSCGEGGLIATRNPSQVASLRQLSNFGIDSNGNINEFDNGTNAKLSEYHSAIGLENLKTWVNQYSSRKKILARYIEQFTKNAVNVKFQAGIAGQCLSIFNIQLNSSSERDKVEYALMQKNIETRKWYCPIVTEHQAFKNLCAVDNLDNAKYLAETVLGLPFHLFLSSLEIDTIVSIISSSLKSDDSFKPLKS